MILLIDTDRIAEVRATTPAARIRQHGATPTVYGYYSSDEVTGPCCGRCNRLLHHHLWQLTHNDTVLDCAVSE